MAQEAHDEPVADAIALLRGVQRLQNAGDRHIERNAALSMALRIEEDLDMADIVGRHAL